jgi:UDP-N-acetylmuramate--alanine ligase
MAAQVEQTLEQEQRTQTCCVSRFSGKRVHFIGIGGCGMSGLAHILADAGAIVTGSEPKPNGPTLQLMKRGIKVSRVQEGELLSREVNLVVRTAAVKDDNKEFQYATRTLNLEHVKYAQLLGQVMEERLGVAVAGTHGKSTTTAMTAYALMQCGIDPSFVVGGVVPQLGGGSHSGKGEAFVVEACEYDRSFHNLQPVIALITNIEAEHLDCYRNLEDIVASFQHFAEMVPRRGLVIVNGQDQRAVRVASHASAPVQTVGFDGDYTWSIHATGLKNGCCMGQISRGGQVVAKLELSVPGRHNLFDATMAIAASVACGASAADAAAAINSFTGVDRRMSVVGTYHGARFIDDYGHHPTEIRVTLDALRQRYAPKRLIVVFQPHQHSRTRTLLADFASAFVAADLVLIPDIYAVRDSDAERRAISSRDLVAAVRANGQDARYIQDFESIGKLLEGLVGEGDLVLTIGAGNVFEIGRDLVASPTEQ